VDKKISKKEEREQLEDFTNAKPIDKSGQKSG